MKLAFHRRPKKVDIDRSEGAIKRLLRRWWRVEIKRWTRREIEEARRGYIARLIA